MAKAFVLGNGTMMVGLGRDGLVYDLYYPYVGLENHTAGGNVHRVGVYVDDSVSWLDDGSWDIDTTCTMDTMSTSIVARHSVKNIELKFEDVVYNEKNIFIRKITVKNLLSTKRTVKLYMNHQFEIYEAHRGDTAYYDAENRVVVHYKGRRVFLMNADYEKLGIDDYSIGLNRIEGHEGTYKDAEDGKLSQNPIEHGYVDSTIGFTLEVKGNDEYTLYYWMCLAKDIHEAKELNIYVLEKTPQYLIETTQNYWKAWVNKQNFNFYNLDERIVTLFKRSLLTIRAHIDYGGAIIAAGDSDLLKQGRDYYNYVWPRDGAFTARVLSKAGYSHTAKKFFLFCNKAITEQGYLMHKYRPDGSLGASWHPWIHNGEKRIPIQEDETALVLYALWEYYTDSKDLEFIESMYNPLIKKAAEFMVSYMDHDIGLPMPSYDLWEEKYGIFTFTSASVYAGLMAASRFAGILGKSQSELKYRTFAEKIKKSIIEELYDEENGVFYKSAVKQGNIYIKDRTLDISSFYALFQFGILDVDDPKFPRIVENIQKRLVCQTEVGGIARYEGDYYFRVSEELPGNPWIITTLWLAQYYIRKAKSEADFEEALKLLNWAVDRALPSGVLSEQMNPYTGEQLSATPLTWSHSEYVATVILYLERLEELGICQKYNPIV